VIEAVGLLSGRHQITFGSAVSMGDPRTRPSL